MHIRAIAVLTLTAALGFAVPTARAFEAPWSSIDFLEDQRWFQINNRLINQNLEIMNDSISDQAEQSDGVSRDVLGLGASASTDLAPLRPYLAENNVTEEQAARILLMYAEIAGRLDVPANDSASGIAAFLAGTYAAYTNEPFPDAYFNPLYEQFAESLTSDDELSARPLAERTEHYQRLVVTGMVYQLLQLELQSDPQPDEIAAMRNAAGRAFEDIAGISPDSIYFTAEGLRPR